MEGGGGRYPPPVNHSFAQVSAPGQRWQQPAPWPGATPPMLYPQLSSVPLQPAPGISLQPLVYQPPPSWGSYGQPVYATPPPAGPQHQQQQPWGIPPNFGRGGRAGPRPQYGARGGTLGRGQPRGGRAGTAQGRGIGPARGGRSGRGAPGRSLASSQAVNGRASGGPSAGVGSAQANGQPSSPPMQGKMSAKLRRLAEAEAAPKPAKIYTADELAEAARWQEERRKHFPTEENVAKKAANAKAMAERGELDSERQNKNKRLHSILRLQRNLGLAKAAGTDDIPLEDGAHDQGWGGGRGRGRSRRGGGPRGRGPRGRHHAFNGSRIEYHSPPPTPASKRPALEPPSGSLATPEKQRKVQAEPAAEQDGLLAEIMANYGSEEEACSPSVQQVDATAEEQPAVEAVQDSAGPLHSDISRASQNGQLHPGTTGAAPMESELPESKQQPLAAGKMQQRPQVADGDVDSKDPDAVGSTHPEPQAQGVAGSLGKSAWVQTPRKSSGRGNSNIGHHRQNGAQQLRPRRPPLLQQLLAHDIRQEHNHLLQAFRFIVNNNFLQDVSKPLVFPSTEDSPLDVQADLLEAMSEGSSSSGEELGEDSEGSADEPAVVKDQQ